MGSVSEADLIHDQLCLLRRSLLGFVLLLCKSPERGPALLSLLSLLPLLSFLFMLYLFILFLLSLFFYLCFFVFFFT